MSKVLSYKTAKKYAHLKCHMERTELEVATKDGKYKAPVMTRAGSKGARKAMGTPKPGELNGTHRGNCSHVMYQGKFTNKKGVTKEVTMELDVRGKEEQIAKDKSINAAKQKEAIKFRAGIIRHKAPLYVTRQAGIVIDRIARMMIEDSITQDKLCDHNPYQNTDYKYLWLVWSDIVSDMEFKTNY